MSNNTNERDACFAMQVESVASILARLRDELELAGRGGDAAAVTSALGDHVTRPIVEMQAQALCEAARKVDQALSKGRMVVSTHEISYRVPDLLQVLRPLRAALS